MGILLTLPITVLNFFLPFTKPGTPLLQDLIHTIILCGTLYCAPQIAEWYNTRTNGHNAPDQHNVPDQIDEPGIEPGDETPPIDEPPLDDRFVLQHDGEDIVGPPPPLAPTPPPAQQNGQPRQQAPLPHVDDFPEPDPFLHNNNHNAEAAFDAPGPANERPRATPANRVIGAKKAKSLARKDQRRAYHEFHRQEAELRRLQEQEGAEEREAALAAEKARRAVVEEEIREREREERERRKEEERKEADEEVERRERVVQRCRDEVQERGAIDLVDVAWAEGKDKLWIERLVRASGLLGQLREGGAFVMITGSGWLVRVDKELMAQAYANASSYGDANGGKLSITEFGSILEEAVLARAKA